MPGTMRLGHTVIYVSDLDTSREWYRQHLGMTVVVVTRIVLTAASDRERQWERNKD